MTELVLSVITRSMFMGLNRIALNGSNVKIKTARVPSTGEPHFR